MAYDIRGVIVDPDGEPMIAATVRLLKANADSTFVRATKTDTNGAFAFTGVNRGKYIVEGNCIGYTSTFVNAEITNKSLRLGEIALKEGGIALREVTVTGTMTDIKVMEDTVEYNAGSYKTQPNAVVEDLLKRLPGVEVDSEGGITANGKTVSKILLDGQEFFADDPKVASKNLPVDMIEKLQVIDRKSDLARLTGVDDGEEETVINLTVKKGMKNGYFGTIEAGYGTKDHYIGQFNVNRFWNDNQVTLLGNFNNINELGFTDSNGSRFRRFGGNRGLTTSQALGLNFNVGNKEIFRIGGNILYSHNDRNVVSHNEKEYLLRDSWQTEDEYSKDKSHNIRADFRIQWKPDSFNTLEARPRISYNLSDSESLDSILNRTGGFDGEQVSRQYQTSTSDGRSLEYGAQIIFNHNFRRHRGRSFSIDLNYSHSNVHETEESFSRNRFYLYGDSLDIYDQITRNHTWSDNISGRLSWTEPLGNVANGRFLTLAYRVNYRWNDADKFVYDHPVTYPWQDPTLSQPIIDYINEVLNTDLSNQFRNDYLNQDIRLGFRQVTSTMNLEAGLSLVPTMSKSLDLINENRNVPERWVWNFAPFLNYRHRFSKSRSLNARYNGRTSQPSISQLQPVPDMSDPMNVIYGNPALKPSFAHQFNLRFQDFDMATQRSIMTMMNVGLTQNSIVSSVVRNYDTGSQETRYENVNGTWNANLMAIYSQPLRNKSWQVSGHVFGMYNQTVGFTDGTKNTSRSMNISFSPSIAFRPTNLQLELRPNYSFRRTTNTMPDSKSSNVHSYGGSFNAYYYTPVGIVLNSDLRFSATRGYAQGFDRDQWIWDCSISYQMLRDKSLTISLKAYDLLGQRSAISHSENNQYIQDSSVNTLTRYFMATISWKFNTFGKGNEPSRRDGMGGPGGHGGPGMGGPGGGPGGGGGRGRM